MDDVGTLEVLGDPEVAVAWQPQRQVADPAGRQHVAHGAHVLAIQIDAIDVEKVAPGDKYLTSKRSRSDSHGRRSHGFALCPRSTTTRGLLGLGTARSTWGGARRDGAQVLERGGVAQARRPGPPCDAGDVDERPRVESLTPLVVAKPGDRLDVLDLQARALEQAAHRRWRELADVHVGLGRAPRGALAARDHAAAVRHLDRQPAAGPERAARPLERVDRVGDVLEHVPHRDRLVCR